MTYKTLGQKQYRVRKFELRCDQDLSISNDNAYIRKSTTTFDLKLNRTYFIQMICIHIGQHHSVLLYRNGS